MCTGFACWHSLPVLLPRPVVHRCAASVFSCMCLVFVSAACALLHGFFFCIVAWASQCAVFFFAPSVVCLFLEVARLKGSRGLPWVTGLFGGLPQGVERLTLGDELAAYRVSECAGDMSSHCPLVGGWGACSPVVFPPAYHEVGRRQFQGVVSLCFEACSRDQIRPVHYRT